MHNFISCYKGIKYVLEKFGSNIIFSNGLRDPYSSGGYIFLQPNVPYKLCDTNLFKILIFLFFFCSVLYNISDTVVALYTEEGK